MGMELHRNWSTDVHLAPQREIEQKMQPVARPKSREAKMVLTAFAIAVEIILSWWLGYLLLHLTAF
jgi:hypothetical protein